MSFATSSTFPFAGLATGELSSEVGWISVAMSIPWVFENTNGCVEKNAV
jgi:4-hydroxybenzoate polyprenyltransferase